MLIVWTAYVSFRGAAPPTVFGIDGCAIARVAAGDYTLTIDRAIAQKDFIARWNAGDPAFVVSFCAAFVEWVSETSIRVQTFGNNVGAADGFDAQVIIGIHEGGGVG